MAIDTTIKPVRNSIARRLIIVTAVFSVLATLLITGGQLYLDYNKDVRAIHTRIEQIRSGHLVSLVDSIWSFDERSTQIQLEGLLRMTDIEYLSISKERKELWLVGELVSENVISVELPLKHLSQGENVRVGVLRVVASIDSIYGRLIKKGFTILLSVGILMFLVTGFLFFIVQNLVTRHLTALATHVRAAKFDDLAHPFHFETTRKHGGPQDEIDDIAHAMNEMRVNLTTAYGDLMRLSQAIEHVTVGIALFDEEDRLVIYNDQYKLLMDVMEDILKPGVTFEEMVRTIVSRQPVYEARGREEEYIIERMENHRNPGAPVELHRDDRKLLASETRTPTGNTLIILTDITEQRQAEALIRESYERQRQIMESSPYGVSIISDTDRQRRLYVNLRFVELFGGQSAEHMLKLRVDENYADPEADNRTVTGGENGAYDTEVISERLRQDGIKWWCHVYRHPIRFEGENAIISWHEDITDRKNLENQLRQSQRMEAVGQLTGGIAHDFNNLLGVMIGNAELLEGRIGDNENAERNIERIKKAVNRGTFLTQRLLAFSRQQTLSPVSTDVTNLISGLEEMLRRTLGETVDLRIVTSIDLWPATIDPHQFENALINLAINARDAMPESGTLVIETANVTLDATYASQYDDVTLGNYVQVSVSDTGTGMTSDVLAKVFEPFFTTKSAGKGSGLGLSMVYGFVKQSNGHITIYSEVDHGTTIQFYIPQSKDAATQKDDKDIAPEIARGSERILVVEDDEDLREVPVFILADQGYEIIEAKDGIEAIEHLRNRTFDLLFTDVVLPGGMTGVDIAEQAKNIQPNIKVLYTSGYTENAVIRNVQRDPGVTLLNKPYVKAELLKNVREVLDSESD